MKPQPKHEYRHYLRSDCAVFRKTNEPFGGLSNMAGGYPLVVNGVKIRTSEALYQACRFPHLPDLQAQIIGERSPMAAKMRGKPFRSQSRPDWDAVRVSVMRWSLRVKILQHWSNFAGLLLETGDRPIVEHSRRDRYWGAVALNDEELEGQNVLGRLLMELRGEILEVEGPQAISPLQPPDVPDFKLLGKPLEPIIVPLAPTQELRVTDPSDQVRPTPPAPRLFD